jgi:hypothetical protein
LHGAQLSSAFELKQNIYFPPKPMLLSAMVKLDVQFIFITVDKTRFHPFEPVKYFINNKITYQNKRTVNKNSLKSFLIVFYIIWHGTGIIPQGRKSLNITLAHSKLICIFSYI